MPKSNALKPVVEITEDTSANSNSESRHLYGNEPAAISSNLAKFHLQTDATTGAELTDRASSVSDTETLGSQVTLGSKSKSTIRLTASTPDGVQISFHDKTDLSE
ncbi:unnamed protein product [Protopolystoma xenopodis]|uniref:Uncharacterized protein n=1 Tax=Protopolystoma xenopodis TaxID=117903 RepID=A0A448WHM5_9PLAT|nr:unnamed protein product [Protopolystoma xenopodis]